MLNKTDCQLENGLFYSVYQNVFAYEHLYEQYQILCIINIWTTHCSTCCISAFSNDRIHPTNGNSSVLRRSSSMERLESRIGRALAVLLTYMVLSTHALSPLCPPMRRPWISLVHFSHGRNIFFIAESTLFLSFAFLRQVKLACRLMISASR